MGKQNDTAAGPGPKPDLRWIKITQLYVPTEYQRSTKSRASANNISYISSHFNWADCGLIVCPLADSEPPQYAVIDGQHRLRAAEQNGGIDELPCVVIEERGLSSQARNFVVINSKRVKLNPLQEYHAAVVAGEPDAVALDAILKKCGVAIAAHTLVVKEMHPRVTIAVGTLLKMIQEYSEKQIVGTLTAITEAYPDTPGMLRANLIRVVGQFIKAFPDADRQALVAALQGIDVDDLEKEARTFKQIQGGTTSAAMLAVLERQYKKALRKAA